MSRYIDADATLNTIKKCLYETALNNFITDRKFADDCEEIAKHRLAIWIDIIPSADVVEVVRCKDCKWFNQIGCAISIVDDSDKPTENDYCSFGERREDAKIH